MEKKTWKEFKDTKLLWWVNRFIQLFGWVIVFQEDDDGTVLDVYPARTQFRGFPEQTEDEGFNGLTRYIHDESKVLCNDVGIHL